MENDTCKGKYVADIGGDTASDREVDPGDRGPRGPRGLRMVLEDLIMKGKLDAAFSIGRTGKGWRMRW